jgi:hypothetical protein
MTSFLFSPAVRSWFMAFLLTQAVEVPIWQWSLRPRPLLQRLIIGFGPTLLTHPLLWMLWPLGFPRNYWVAVAVGETGVVLAEAAYIRLWGVKAPLAWSLLANSASFLTGLLWRFLFGGL